MNPVFVWLREHDPEGNLLTRAAGVTIGTLLLVGIIAGARTALMDPVDSRVIQDLETKIDQALAPGADFEITDVTYTENATGSLIALHLIIRRITDECAKDLLVLDLTRDAGTDIYQVAARWLLGTRAWQEGNIVEVPTVQLPEGRYRIVVRACGGVSPGPTTEFFVSRNPP